MLCTPLKVCSMFILIQLIVFRFHLTIFYIWHVCAACILNSFFSRDGILRESFPPLYCELFGNDL